jgi:hypothetical protein
MYNGIPWWHKCGSSSGKILIKPDQSCYETWHQYIKDNRKEEYIKAMTQKEGVSGPVTGAKLRVLSMIMDACKVKQKDYVHGYERGVYYSSFYKNTREFLQNKITEKDLIIQPRIQGNIQSIMDWWKPKAINRFRKLFLENNVKDSVLFYLPMCKMKYEEAKEISPFTSKFDYYMKGLTQLSESEQRGLKLFNRIRIFLRKCLSLCCINISCN